MGANNIQIGGEHYQIDYQHWDFVIDLKIPYLLAVATKYPTRWRDKNGVEDLRKSLHYLQKAKETGTKMPRVTWFKSLFAEVDGAYLIRKFAFQLPPTESNIILCICNDDLDGAILLLNDLIESEELGAGPNYIKG